MRPKISYWVQLLTVSWSFHATNVWIFVDCGRKLNRVNKNWAIIWKKFPYRRFFVGLCKRNCCCSLCQLWQVSTIFSHTRPGCTCRMILLLPLECNLDAPLPRCGVWHIFSYHYQIPISLFHHSISWFPTGHDMYYFTHCIHCYCSFLFRNGFFWRI